MNCQETRSLLNDYADGELEPADVTTVEKHLAECPACLHELEALRTLLGEAARLPKSVMPQRNLFSAIQAQIEQPATRPILLQWQPVLRSLALAAVLLVIATVGLETFRSAPRHGGTAHIVTPEPTPMELAEQACKQAKAVLLEALEEEETSLSPETVVAIRDNLVIIEQAVDDIQLALEEDPKNPYLTQMLLATYVREVELLQQAVQLTQQG